MVSFGSIGFLQPWLLFGLLSLPLIWYILKLIPPRPEKVLFPPVRLLLGLKNLEQTARTIPWWLLLLRIGIVSLLILAFSEPVWEPKIQGTGDKTDKIILVDNGWASGTAWNKYKTVMENLVADAEVNGQRLLILGTANKPEANQYKFVAPKLSHKFLHNLQPQPYKPDREVVLEKLLETLQADKNYSLAWISDGLQYGPAEKVSRLISQIAKTPGSLEVYKQKRDSALGLFVYLKDNGNLVGRVLSAGGQDRKGSLLAWNSKGEQLGEREYSINADETYKDVEIVLPHAIRNQVVRISIDGETSAGATFLLDTNSLRYRVGVISGETSDISQPLLSPTYYINKALSPYVDLVSPEKKTITQSLGEIFSANPAVLIMADIGNLSVSDTSLIEKWVEQGGVLIRFSGYRMQTKTQELLPVKLRQGRRALGGALSWSTPQAMAKFEKASPFYGLLVDDEIKIKRQVLADPQSLAIEGEVWSRLNDGTPLVTAKKTGKGWITLFHTTANSEWSNLPLSGLFVEMLKRLTNLSSGASININLTGEVGKQLINKQNEKFLAAPFQILNGFGGLVEPSPSHKPIDMNNINKVRVNADIHPGYYGSSRSYSAVNILHAKSSLKHNSYIPSGAEVYDLNASKSMPLMAFLICIAIFLLLLDTVVKILSRPRNLSSDLTMAKLFIFLCFLLSGSFLADSVYAQDKKKSVIDEKALRASLDTRLGYVITGDKNIDRISKYGLSGLSRVIAARTAVEPSEPVGVNIHKDELVFFPMIYWPVLKDVKTLPDAVLSKVDAYLKLGGMILFDTKDAKQSSLYVGRISPGMLALQRLTGRLNIPRLEPAFEGHVVTKSFYLLKSFPGRWDSGKLWVEARKSQHTSGEKKISRSDGVSSIIVTSNDFSGAWALDENNRPLLPVVPGGEFQREMAFRVGVNIVLYALTGNYKADQVHVPALLERLGQ